MTVYGEFLFIENFLTGYGLLRLTGILCGRRPSGARVAAGAVMCGVFAFVVVMGFSRPAAFGAEAVFSLGLMWFVFRPGGQVAVGSLAGDERKNTAAGNADAVKHAALDNAVSVIRLSAVFLTVSFMLGGAVMAFIYVIGVKGIISNGILYIGHYGYVIVLSGIALGLTVMGTVADSIRKTAPKGEGLFPVTVELMGKTLKCFGKVDTGNSLREPLSGEPVSLIQKETAKRVWGDLMYSSDISEYRTWEEKLYGNQVETDIHTELKNRIRLIPFRSVGCSGGMLTAVRCDSITLCRRDMFGRGKIFLRDVYIGIYDGVFDSDNGQSYDVLLQPEMITALKTMT